MLVGQLVTHHAQAASEHDGLVVTPLHAIDDLFIFSEIAQQIGPAKFIVECGTAQRTIGHDLQCRRHVRRMANATAPQLGDTETSEACFGFGTSTGGTLVTNFSASACGGTGKRRNRRGVVMGFYLHQYVLHAAAFVVTRHEAL